MSAGLIMRQALLDWSLGGATPTQPSAHFVGLAIGALTSIAASEATAAGYARQTVAFAAAATPTSSGLATNVSNVVFTFSAAQVISGMQIWNSSAGGSMLYIALTSAVSSMVSGDSLTFTPGGLTVSAL